MSGLGESLRAATGLTAMTAGEVEMECWRGGDGVCDWQPVQGSTPIAGGPALHALKSESARRFAGRTSTISHKWELNPRSLESLGNRVLIRHFADHEMWIPSPSRQNMR